MDGTARLRIVGSQLRTGSAVHRVEVTEILLLSYTGVGIVQEHAANRILRDLVEVCQPVRMSVVLDYNVRGGLHTTVTARYEED